ncbi:TetR/AcrR family transcriptional regulator [Streptomyces sp. NPDC058357]|uniref:TetR/AcrR family transcriptional regulator n=1 Tax=unclassified Streptomyces TaxID=2593676 RepID=UPI00366377A1
MDAATQLLAREGARALTHRAIAAEVGTTHGIARYYFGTLDQVLDEALQRLATRQIEEVRALFHQLPDVDIPQRITRIVQYVTGSLVSISWFRRDLFYAAWHLWALWSRASMMIRSNSSGGIPPAALCLRHGL